MQIPIRWEAPQRLFRVSDLTEAIRRTLASEFTDIWVAGETSGTKTAPSGHIYFTLKDENAQIRCVCFSGTARFLRFKPKDGIEVLARGRIDVYAPRGEYQFLVDAIEPRGYGALQVAFEQLKQKLAAEGLFDAARKRPIPPYPRRIGIVTSPSGAVIRDLLNILTRRFPGLHIRLYPALVQGEGSAEQVCRAIEFFSRSQWAEVVIVARGGGSVEDLWTFNEEAVARAIAACTAPVISAVGHETDFTIADFVADLRAPTPSAAAELAVGTRQQVLERLEAADTHLRQAMRFRLANARSRWRQVSVDRAGATLHRMIGKRLQRTDELEGSARETLRNVLSLRRQRLLLLDMRLKRMDLRLRLAEGRRRLDAAAARIAERIRWLLAAARMRLEPLEAHLTQLSPLGVLDRGYAIVQTPDGQVVKDAAEAAVGSALRVRLARGQLQVRVERSR
ncbi:MAG: exodeoxyribonuclease VII large subunit [Acidobacteria bacterium]|nr:exodeoxyribonuclease VII large subunit [Acidobacteriota bacterium]